MKGVKKNKGGKLKHGHNSNMKRNRKIACKDELIPCIQGIPQTACGFPWPCSVGCLKRFVFVYIFFRKTCEKFHRELQ
jgi:hypothetical protein